MNIIKNLFYRTGRVKNNKSWELQIFFLFRFSLVLKPFEISFEQYPLFDIDIFGIIQFNIYRSTMEDHAGLYINVSLFGLNLLYSYYDVRHWNYDEGRWETEEDIAKEAQWYINHQKYSKS